MREDPFMLPGMPNGERVVCEGCSIGDVFAVEEPERDCIAVCGRWFSLRRCSGPDILSGCDSAL